MSVLVQRLATYSNNYTTSSIGLNLGNIATLLPVVAGINGTIVVNIFTRMGGVSRVISSLTGTGQLSTATWAQGPTVTVLNSSVYYTLDNWVSETAYWRGGAANLTLNFNAAPSSAIVIVVLTVYSGLKKTSVLDITGAYTPYSLTVFPSADAFCKTNSRLFSSNCLMFGSMAAATTSGLPLFSNPEAAYPNWQQFNEKGTGGVSLVANDKIYEGVGGTQDLQLRLTPDPSSLPNSYRANLGTIFYLKPLDVNIFSDQLNTGESFISTIRPVNNFATLSNLVRGDIFSFSHLAALSARDSDNLNLLASNRFFETSSLLPKSVLQLRENSIINSLSYLGLTESELLTVLSNIAAGEKLLLYAILNDKVFFLNAYLASVFTTSLQILSYLNTNAQFSFEGKSFLRAKYTLVLAAYLRTIFIETGTLKLLAYFGQKELDRFALLTRLATKVTSVFTVSASLKERFIFDLLSKLTKSESNSLLLASILRTFANEFGSFLSLANLSLKPGSVGDLSLFLQSALSREAFLDSFLLKAFALLPPFYLRAYLGFIREEIITMLAYLSHDQRLLMLAYIRSHNFEDSSFLLKSQLISLKTAIGLNLAPRDLILNLTENVVFLKAYIGLIENATLSLQSILRAIETIQDDFQLLSLITSVNSDLISLNANLATMFSTLASLSYIEQDNISLIGKLQSPQTVNFDVSCQIYSNYSIGR